jgi:glycerol-3-phosphate acyltransferase PlsY
MEHPLITMICLLNGYLIGSVMGAYWTCKIFNLPDPSQSGSGNPGATNIYRISGPLPATLTLGWDAFKGALAVTLSTLLSDHHSTYILVALATITGHAFPIFHRFRGGKGVATAMGASLLLAPATTMVLIAAWCTMFYWKRISSLASLSTAALAPCIAWWLNPQSLLLFACIALFLFASHRHNIMRLTKKLERPLK